MKSERGFTKWLHVSKGGSGPEMMIRHWGPDTDIPVHSHPYHEMFFVLEGEIEIDGKTYQEGSCIYIEKNTPYGPTRAPKGGKVLRYAEAGMANRVQSSLEVEGLRTFYIKAGGGHPYCALPRRVARHLLLGQLEVEYRATRQRPAFACSLPASPTWFRSHRQSERLYSLDFRFAHARAFVDKTIIGRYHVMGNSMGAYIAARLALEYLRVERLGFGFEQHSSAQGLTGVAGEVKKACGRT